MRETAQRARSWAARVATLTLLATTACVDVPQDPPWAPAHPITVADFNPTAGKVPFPITLTCSATDPATGACISGGTYDATNGKVALPITPCATGQTTGCDNGDSQLLKAGLNTLDGFATYGELSTTFDKPISRASLSKATAFIVDSTTGAVATFKPKTLCTAATAAGCTTYDDKTLLFQPEIPEDPSTLTTATVTRPLRPETMHFAIVTRGVLDANGKPIEPDTTFTFARSRVPVANSDGTAIPGTILSQRAPADLGCSPTAAANVQAACANTVRATLEKLRQGYDQIFTALEAAPTPIQRESIAVLWPVRTQSTAKAFLGLRQALALVPPTRTAPPQGVIPGAVVYPTGTLPPGVPLAVANFQLGCVQTATLLSPTTGAFGAPVNGVPPFRPSYVPYVASFPATAAPAGGYPVVIFGHGFTRWRYDMIAIANSLATAGIATIAIDHPWHGDRSATVLGQENADPTLCIPSAPAQNPPPRCVAPATYNAGTMACSDGSTPVPSGKNIFSATNLFATRDNMRQAVLDLMQLTRVVKAARTATDAPTFDSTKIFYAGQSLGGIVGTVFTAVEPDVKLAVLNVPGGGLANIIENTETNEICKPIFDALETKGICQRANAATAPCECAQTPAYVQFIHIVQWILDPSDPINFGAYLVDKSLYCTLPTGAAVPCAAVPSGVTATPIKKRVLFQRMTNDHVIPNITTNALVGAAGPNACYRNFTGGEHGFLLSPASSPTATAKGQAQAVSFLATGGTATFDGRDQNGVPVGQQACPTP